MCAEVYVNRLENLPITLGRIQGGADHSPPPGRKLSPDRDALQCHVRKSLSRQSKRNSRNGSE